MTLGVRNRLPLLPINVAIIAIVLFTYTGEVKSAGQQYVGKFLGKLSELHHGVSGEVYAVDGRTLHIKDFTYDGQGPAAYFYAGNSKEPSNLGGFRVPDERGSTGVLKRYRKHSITLALPDGKTLNNIKWFSVWCDEFSVNFGDIRVPRNFEYPKPQKIDPLNGVHNIASDNIVIVDAQTLLVPNLSYDGEAPDAKFWVGRGPKPSPQGIRVPDENGKEIPLRRYDRKTVVLTLPQDLTVFDIGHFGIWCEAFTVDFGHVQIPSNLNVPPSLKMLGISPQKRASPFLSPETQSVAPLAQAHVYPQQGQVLAATTYRPPQFERFHTQQTQHISHRQPFAFAQQNYFNRRLDTNQLPANNNNNAHYQQQQQQHNQQLIYNQQLVPQPTNNVLFYQQNQLNNQRLYNNPQLQTQQTIYNQQRFNNQQQLLYEQQLLSARQQREYQLERQRLHNNQALQLQNHLAQSSNRFDVVQQPNYFVQFG